MMMTFIHRCVFVVVVAIFLGLNLAARVVVANQPVVRFRNKTVGIVAEGDADVVVASEKVKLTGDLEVKTTNNGTINVTEKMDLLASLQDDIGQRVQHLAQHGDMGVVCNPKYTEYRAKDLETGTFGECVCKTGYDGSECGPILFVSDDTPRNFADSVAYCESLPEGPYALASIHSQEEQDMVAQLMYNMTGPVKYGWVVAYIGGMTEGDGVWYWYDGTPWDFRSEVRDAMKGKGETRLAITDQTGGKWHDWNQGQTELGVICRHQGH